MAPFSAWSPSRALIAFALTAALFVTANAVSFGGNDEDCTVVTLLYPDEALVFVPVEKSLKTGSPESGSIASGFGVVRHAGYRRLPSTQSLEPVMGAGCKCLDEVYLEADLRVPHTTTKVTRLVLEDSNGKTVVDIRIPEEQQTRFTFDGSDLLNRIRIPLEQSSKPSGRLSSVQRVRLYRAGNSNLDNINPAKHKDVFWVLTSLRFRRGCKECGQLPGSYGHMNALVPLTASGEPTTLLGDFSELRDTPVDLSPVVDPMCRCLQPSFDASATPTVRMQVQLRHRDVYPRNLRFSTADGTVVWEGAVPRASTSSIGSWQTLTVALGGRDNVWQVGSVAGDRDGSVPPWHEVYVSLERKSLVGVPSADEVPIVRNVVLYGGSDSAEGTYVSMLQQSNTTLSVVEGTPVLSNGTVWLPLDWTDLPVSAHPVDLGAITARTCATSDCGGAVMLVDVAAWQPSGASVPRIALGGLVLRDSSGAQAQVAVPLQEVANQMAADNHETVTVRLPLNEATVSADNGFAWGAVLSVSGVSANAVVSTAGQARASGGLSLSNVRLGTPQRVGHVSDPADYNSDDLACDPVTGTYDFGEFVRSDPVRYGHCRECCCFFDNPADPTVRHCYEQGAVIADVTPSDLMAPNDQCAVCNRDINSQVMTPRNFLLEVGADPPYALCDDGELCSYNDRCRDDGACVADVYTTCLIKDFHGGDPTKDCEVCDGTGPNSTTMGCAEKPGHAVYMPGTEGRQCGCRIDGEVFPHGAINPRLPCTICDVTKSTTEWTNRPNDIACDFTLQHDWANLARQACSYGAVCQDGECRGTGYTCPPLQTCEAPVDEFPHVCDMSGPASETGGCQRRNLDAGVECAPEVHGCMPASQCLGTVGTCPPQFQLPGIIYDDTGKQLRLLLPDGSDIDAQYPVLPSLDAAVLVYDRFRVQCGDLQLHSSVIPAGDCFTSRVAEPLGNGWGSGFSPVPRGSFTAVARPLKLVYIDGSLTLGDSEGASGDDVVRVDVGATNFSEAIADVFLSAGVADPFLDVAVRRQRGLQLMAAQLVDEEGNTVDFPLPPARVNDAWTVVSARGTETITSTFDWKRVVGLRFSRSGLSTVSGLVDGTELFAIGSVRVRTRAQAPPCLRVPIGGAVDAGEEPLVATLDTNVGHSAFVATLQEPVDVSTLYDDALNRFSDHVYLSMEVRGLAPGATLAEVAVLGTDGEGVIAGLAHPAPADADAASHELAWTRVVVRLRASLLTAGVTDSTFLSVASVRVAFASAPEAATTALIRRAHLVRGALCAHDVASQQNDAHSVMVASSGSPHIVLQPVADSTQLRATSSAGADTSSAAFDLNLADHYDADCNCFPNTVLHMEVALPSSHVGLARMDLVEVSTDAGVQLTLPSMVPYPGGVPSSATYPADATYSTEAADGVRVGTVTASLFGDHVSVVGTPSSWANINAMRFWRTLRADVDDAAVGDIVIRSVTLYKKSVPCVSSTSTNDVDYVAAPGATIMDAGEVVLALGDAATGFLTPVPSSEGGDGTTAFSASSQVAAWVEGGVGGDDVATAAALVARSSTRPAVLVTAGTVAGRGVVGPDGGPGVVSVAGFPMASTHPTPTGFLAARDVSTGAGLWLSSLGRDVVLRSITQRGDLLVGVGSAGTVPGSPVEVAGVTSVANAASASSAVAVVVDIESGSMVGVDTVPSTGAGAWLGVAAGPAATVHGDAVIAVGVASGTVSLPISGGDASLIAPAAEFAIVAAYGGATDVVDGTAVMWARAFGGNSSSLTARLSSVDAPTFSPLAFVSGVYSGGELLLDGVQLPAPQPQASHAFVAALNMSTGAVEWAHVVQDHADMPYPAAGPAVLASASAGKVTLCAPIAASPAFSVVATIAASGSFEWQTHITGASCNTLTASGVDEVAVVATVEATAGEPTLVSWASRGVDVPVAVVPMTVDTTQVVVIRVDTATADVVGPAELFGGSAATVHSHSVSAADGTIVVVGAASGIVTFGSGSSIAAAPMVDAASSDALTVLFSTGTQVGTSVPQLVYRDGSSGDEEGVAVTSLSAVTVVATSIAANRVTGLAPSVGAQSVGSEFASGATLGALHSVSDGGAVPFGRSVLGTSWGVTGSSAWTSLVASGASSYLVAGHVNGVTSAGLVSAPGASQVARLAYPDTQEPLVASFDMWGRPQWVVSTGATATDDFVSGIGFDARRRLGVVVGTSGADGLFMCADGFGEFGEVEAAGDCTAGFITVLAFDDARAAAKPSSMWTTFVGGHGVSVSVSHVDTAASGLTSITGTVRRTATAYAPQYVDAALRVPSSLWESAQADVAQDNAATLVPPMDGAQCGWVAAYDTGRGHLLWASLSCGSSTADDVVVRGSSVSQGNVVVCGSARGSVRHVVAAPGATASADSEDAVAATAPTSDHAATFVAGFSTEAGSALWSQWVSGSHGASSCTAIIAEDDTVVVTGSVTAAGGATQAWAHVTGGASLKLGGGDSAWVAQFDASSSTPVRLSGLAASSANVHAAAATFTQRGGSVAVVGSSNGGTIHPSMPGVGLVDATGGAYRAPQDTDGSWDAFLAAFPVDARVLLDSNDAPVALQSSGDDLPAAFGVAVHGAFANTDVNTLMPMGTDVPAAGSGLGFATGVAVGSHHVASAGYFKGTLTLDGSVGAHVLVAASAVGEADYDSLLVLRPVPGTAGATEDPAAVSATVRLVSSVPSALKDDRFRAVASTTDGTSYCIGGHAAVSVPSTVVSLAGPAITLPGGGGRDGFVGMVSDTTFTGAWAAPVGAVSGVDDSIIAVAANDDIVVAGGSIVGAPPTFASVAVYSGSVDNRELATAYALSRTSGAELWGKAWGTDTADGVAATSGVAVDPSGDWLVVAGSFAGGDLLVGDITLASGSAARTSFAVLLGASDGSVAWAKASSMGASAGASAFAVVRGVAVSSSSVILAGQFSASSLGHMSFGDELAAKATAVDELTAPMPHAFVATLDIADGATADLWVPQCPAGCRAGGVAAPADGRLFVAVTHEGRMVLDAGASSEVVVSDPTARTAHRGALVVFGAGAAGVQTVQTMGAGSSGHVDAFAVGAGRSTVAVAGWRSGDVALAGAVGGEAEDSASLEFLPFTAMFNSAARRGAQVTRVARGGAAVVAEAVYRDQVDVDGTVLGVTGAIGRFSMLASATLSTDAAVVADTGYAHWYNSTNSSSHAVVVGLDRHSGAPRWSWGAYGDRITTVDASAATPSGALLCVGGSVHDDGFAIGSLFGVSVAGSRASSGHARADAVVACFDDQAAPVRPQGVVSRDGAVGKPRWSRAFGALGDEGVTAMHATDSLLWVAVSYTGAWEFAGEQVSHSGEEPMCFVGVVDVTTGSELFGVSFGSAGGSCTVSAITSTSDASRVYVAGSFFGTSLELPGLTLAATRADKATPFVAAFDTAGAGRGPYALRFASAAEFTPSTLIPAGDTYATVTGVVLEERRGLSPDRRLYVSGMLYGGDMLWAGMATANRAAGLVGTDNPRAAYVVAFDADAGNLGAAAAASPIWLANIPATTRTGLQSSGGVAVASSGRVAVALTSAAPVSVGAGVIASQPSPRSDGSFAVVAFLDSLSGRPAGTPVVVSDPLPAADGQAPSRALAARVVAASGPGAAQSASGSLVLVGAATGMVASTSGSAHLAGSQAARGFIVYQLGVGSAGGASDTFPVTNNDASGVAAVATDAGEPRMMVQLDVWRSAGTAAVAGGEWRATGPGNGAGFVFQVPADQIAEQAARPREWLTIDAAVAAAPSAAGQRSYGVGGSMYSDLRALSLRIDGANLDSTARWRVRNVRLSHRDSFCVPCGQVPVRAAPVSLVYPDTVPVAGEAVRLAVADEAGLPSYPVDASTIVDPTCNCLRAGRVVWEERIAKMEDGRGGVAIAGVELRNPSGDAGATSMSISYSDASTWVADTEDEDFLWRRGYAAISVADHTRASDMDWAAISSVRFLAAASPELVGAALRVRRVTIDRECPRSPVLLHPSSTAVNSTIKVARGELNLQRGAFYRMITYETNMWGDDQVPTCSAPFVADDTPPLVSGARLLDLTPTDTGGDDPIEYTRFNLFKVGWDGTFSEPESAPDNILLFRIENITVGSPDGPGLVPDDEDMPTEETLLATVSSGYVHTTAELALVDGERYYVHLGVCHRGKLCSEVVSDTGLVHDSSAPVSDAMHISITDDHDAAVVVTEPLDAPVVAAYHQRNDTAIKAVWAAFDDPHSWVEDLRVGLGTAEFGTDIHELAVMPNGSTTVQFGPKAGDAALIHGIPYYVVFLAVNPAGANEFYRTAPLYIDNTPPTAHWVVDVFPRDLSGTESYFLVDENIGDVDVLDGTVVRAKFKCDDAESVNGGTFGNMTYKWRVCNTADCDDRVYVGWQDVGITPRASTNDTVLIEARDAGLLDWVFVQVECTNPVGLSTRLSSDGAFFDDTPPNNASAIVADVDSRLGSSLSPFDGDVDWMPIAALGASWTGFFTEPGRPVLLRYELGVGSAPGLDDVYSFTSVDLATTAFVDEQDMTLQHGETYYLTVVAVSVAGARSTVTSDGVTIDDVPPQLQLIDVVVEGLDLNDTRRCASYMECMDVTSPGVDVDYLASSLAIGMLVTDSVSVAPLATVEYGVSFCDGNILDLSVVPLVTSDSVDAVRFEEDTLQLFHGQRYCGVVFQTAQGTRLTGWNSTNGVTVDLTPPLVGIVHEGTSPLVDLDAVGRADAFNVTATCSDAESGIHHVEFQVLQAVWGDGVDAEYEPISEWQVAPDSFAEPSTRYSTVTFEVTGLSLTVGDWYITAARCVNGAGAYVASFSDGVVLDTSSPILGSASISHTLYNVDVKTMSQTDVLTASWTGFFDPESTVAKFAWSVGTRPHGFDVVPVTDVGPATTATAGPGLGLVDGETYYVTVYATNAAGLVASTASGGVTVDASAPPAADSVVLSLAGAPVSTTAAWISGSLHDVSVDWDDAVDPHGTVTYRWAMGTTPHGQQVLPWASVGTTSEASADGITLLPGMEYFVSVETENEVGLKNVSRSVGVRIDPFPPVVGIVVDGMALADAHTSQIGTSQLDCAWDGFEDQLSGIESYHVGFGSVPGTANTVAAVRVEPSERQFTATGLSLSTGTRYHCVVTAFDNAGNSAKAWSHGSIVDTTAPEAGSVLDVAFGQKASGPAVSDVSEYAQGRMVTVAWPGWRDDESGIVLLEWSLGTSAGDDSIVPWTHVRAHRTWGSVDLNELGLALTTGVTYYGSVRATNAVGLTTEASSDGFVLAPPTEHNVGALNVSARVVYIAASTETSQAWCGCGDPFGTTSASGSVYDPTTGACTCGPELYLATPADDASVRAPVCTACPAGTCKRGLGVSADLCTADACNDPADPTVVPEAPVLTGLTPCGPSEEGRVTRAADGACVCPPGTHLSSHGTCETCAAGTVNPWFADIPECRVCWAPAVPDAAVRVQWDMTALIDQGLSPSSVIVSVGTSRGALRWSQTFAASVSTAEFSSRVAGGPPLRQGGVVFVRVRAIGDSGLVLADTHLAPLRIDFSPPTAGGVSDGLSGGLADATVLGDVSTVGAAWFEFEDSDSSNNDSGVVAYAVAIGSDGVDSTALSDGWVWVSPSETNITVVPTTGAADAVADGDVVTVTVVAYNAHGAWTRAASDGAVVQRVVPDGSVAVVPAPTEGGEPAMHAHVSGLSDGASIAATWAFTSVVPLTYSWSVVYGHNDTVVRDYEEVGSRTWGYAELSTPLLQGHQYVVRVRAENDAGVSRVVDSPMTVIDAVAPVGSVVNATRSGAAFNADYLTPSPGAFQVSTTAIGVEWDCGESAAGVAGVKLAVGSSVGGDQAVAVVTRDEAVGSTEFTELELVHGHCYVAQAICNSNAAVAADPVVSSALCVDSTPPGASIRAVHPLASPPQGTPFLDDSGDTTVSGEDALWQSNPTAASATLAATHIQMAATRLATVVAEQPDASLVYVSAHLDHGAAVSVTAADAESGVTHMDLVWSTHDGEGLSGDLATATAAVSSDAVAAPVPLDAGALPLAGSALAHGDMTFADLATLAAGASVDTATTPLHAHLWVFNGAGGGATDTSTSGIVLDATAPTGGVMVAGHQFDTTSLDLAWAFADPESPIGGVVVEVTRAGAVAGEEPILAPVWVGQATSLVLDGLSLQSSETYVVRATACNLALLCKTDSADVVIDTSAPVGGAVYVATSDSSMVSVCAGPAAEPCTQPPSQVLRDGGVGTAGNLTWAPFDDPESPVTTYRVALGTVALGTQLGDAVALSGDVTSVALSELVTLMAADLDETLFHGATLIASVTAVNAAGLASTTVAPLFAIDESPPTPGVVRINASLAATRVELAPPSEDNDSTHGFASTHLAQASATTLSASWAAFKSDNNVTYTATLVEVATGSVVVGPTPVDGHPFDAVFSIMWDGLSLDAHVLYTVTVVATDVAGNSITTSAVRPVLVDDTAPTQVGASGQVGVVRDGLEDAVDLDCQSRSGVSAEALSPEEIVSIDARSGGAMGKLVATLGGDDSTALDLTGAVVLPAVDASTLVKFRASPFVDAESGVAMVEVALGSTQGAQDLLQWTAIPAQALAVQVALPPQLEGLVVFVSVRATNGVGLAGYARSDGVRLLCQPGTVGCDYDGTFACLGV